MRVSHFKECRECKYKTRGTLSGTRKGTRARPLPPLSNQLMFFLCLCFSVVYARGAGLRFVFIEWRGDEIKEMLGETEEPLRVCLGGFDAAVPQGAPNMSPFLSWNV